MDIPSRGTGLDIGIGVDEVLTKEEYLKRLNYGMDPKEVEDTIKKLEAKKPKAEIDKVEISTTKPAPATTYKPLKTPKLAR